MREASIQDRVWIDSEARARAKASKQRSATIEKEKAIHFPRFDIFYTYKTNRFSLSYVKQVEGVVCTGGICRLEPDFSGVKVTVNSTF